MNVLGVRRTWLEAPLYVTFLVIFNYLRTANVGLS